jgi:hypothetical protein
MEGHVPVECSVWTVFEVRHIDGWAHIDRTSELEDVVDNESLGLRRNFHWQRMHNAIRRYGVKWLYDLVILQDFRV